MKSKSIVSFFKDNNGCLTRSQLKDRKLYEQLLEMIKSGKAERLKNGLYFIDGTSTRSEIRISLKVVLSHFWWSVICLDVF